MNHDHPDDRPDHRMDDTAEDGTEERIPALDALPRERLPPARLEERTVALLRQEGLLGANRRSRGAPHRRPAAWAVAAAAAALALFATGFAAGQRSGARQTVEVVEALQGADARSAAALIQRSGSAYVEALAALGESIPGDTDVGREVAQSVVRSALWELVRLDPGNAALRRALVTLDPERTREGAGPAEGGSGARAVLWF